MSLGIWEWACCLSLVLMLMCVSPQAGSEGFVIDPNGRCFMGKLGHDLKLSGKVRD